VSQGWLSTGYDPTKKERVINHLFYVESLPDFSVQMKAKRFLCYVAAVGHEFLGPFITYDGANIVIICETTFIVSCFFS